MFTRVLVPLDLVVGTEHALHYAREVARRFDAEVLLLHLDENGSLDPEEAGEAHRELADLAEALEKEGIATRTLSRVLELPTVAASEVIVEVAVQERADLILMATHGRRGLRRILLGSVTEEVLRLTRCPVLAVRAAD